jgi:hypothetical protein
MQPNLSLEIKMKPNVLLLLVLTLGISAATHAFASDETATPPEPGAQEDSGADAEKSEAAHIDWDVWCDFNKNVFPSFLLATATVQPPDDEEGGQDWVVLGDKDGRLGVVIQGAGGSTINVTLKKNAIMDESTFSGTIPKDAKEAVILPKVLYDYAALGKIRQPVPLNLVATVELDGQKPVQKAITVTVRSINDCLIARTLNEGEAETQGEAKGEDAPDHSETFDWMFAAYVNENHPGVEKLLKQALAAEIVELFDGYPAPSETDKGQAADHVIQQVFAIWNVLQRQGVKYSSIDTTQSEDPTLESQHVRFLDDVIDNAQANCIDGTVLFASVLRKIGIRPYLVLVPGHAFLAFSLDGSDENLVALETTMMGSTTLKTVDKKNEKLSDEIREKMKNETSWASFEEALDAGSQELDEAASHLKSKDAPGYRLISVAAARRLGIMPIAFKGP